MYKKILVPLDGSSRAERILPHVVKMASSFGSELFLLSVVDLVDAMMNSGVSNAEIIQTVLQKKTAKAKAYMELKKKELQEIGMEPETRVIYGTVVESILQVAEEIDASLIAIASHGRTGLSRVFYGSVAAGLLQRVDRPMLLIRARQE